MSIPAPAPVHDTLDDDDNNEDDYDCEVPPQCQKHWTLWDPSDSDCTEIPKRRTCCHSLGDQFQIVFSSDWKGGRLLDKASNALQCLESIWKQGIGLKSLKCLETIWIEMWVAKILWRPFYPLWAVCKIKKGKYIIHGVVGASYIVLADTVFSGVKSGFL